MHNITKLLAPVGIPYRTIARILNELGDRAAALIRTNPYYLCRVSYFGFKKADEVAMRLGDFADSEFRIRGAVPLTY